MSSFVRTILQQCGAIYNCIFYAVDDNDDVLLLHLHTKNRVIYWYKFVFNPNTCKHLLNFHENSWPIIIDRFFSYKNIFN